MLTPALSNIDGHSMQRKSLTDHQRWTIINALYTAAEQYSGDAARIADNYRADPNIAQLFKTQAKEARALANLIEQALGIEISLSDDATGAT